MLGLFRKPIDNIRKRVDRNDHMLLVAVETYAKSKIQNLPKTQMELAMGFILSVWACNSVASGNISLSSWDYRFIKNLGMNCANRLPSDAQARAEQILDELIERGLVPHSTMP